MMKFNLLIVAFLSYFSIAAQNIFKAKIQHSTTKLPLKGVVISIKDSKITSISDSLGQVLLANIPNGNQVLTLSHLGFEAIEKTYTFPLTDSFFNEVIEMAENEEELDEVIVQTTRTSRTINNTPTRVETIDGEELDEKNNMRPANVSMLLHESTGLQVQQTSATSGNASIRVQGLDGRYTQLLKDGYANFGNFASGLSILEIPPLDLKQVEIIKGPASTLYGGGAIAGVINFISKTPTENFVGELMVNQSNIGQTNIGAFFSQKKNILGFTLLAQYNAQKAYDVDGDDFSEVPMGSNFTFNPKLFYYINPSTTLTVGNSFTKGNLTGGDMQVIKGNANSQHTYFEKNNTIRNTSNVELDKKFSDDFSLKLKQSVTFFDREISIPSFSFSGVNTNSFTDLSLLFTKPKHTFITGFNLVFDKFNQKNVSTHNNQSLTSGIYFQDTWDISEIIKIETGLRIDNTTYKNNNFSNNQSFILPRISSLFKITNKLTTRISGGLGYKIPTIFTEQTESMQYQNIAALSNVEAERSVGGTIDFNYKTMFSEDFVCSINQLFFYTLIKSPLVLESDLLGNYSFTNASNPIITNGLETNLKFIYKEDLKLFVGYTFTNAKATFLTSNQFLTLLPKHKVNLTLMYEKEDNFKLGLESYFTDRQFLRNGNRTPSFWEFGFMAQKTFNKFSIFINFENFTDQRQSSYKTVVNPPHDNPTFDDIWNHTEGRMINGGIKIKL